MKRSLADRQEDLKKKIKYSGSIKARRRTPHHLYNLQRRKIRTPVEREAIEDFLNWLTRNGVRMYYSAEYRKEEYGFFDLSTREARKWFYYGIKPDL